LDTVRLVTRGRFVSIGTSTERSLVDEVSSAMSWARNRAAATVRPVRA
jgi:hypothetical protein